MAAVAMAVAMEVQSAPRQRAAIPVAVRIKVAIRMKLRSLTKPPISLPTEAAGNSVRSRLCLCRAQLLPN
ncbi:MAG TPA: hypothetical protein VNB54_09760, partial [Alphaproteobacteria bacterium]|nr:hypothetical protein [Alphaproteobacteria bacterium]